MTTVLTIWKDYQGAGTYCLLFLIAWTYLFFTEEKKQIRAILVYGAGALQLLFFLPLFFTFYSMLDEGTYYRILWVIPMTVVIAYAGVKLHTKRPVLALILLSLILILGGKYVYSSPYITKAENLYHLPQEAINICDAIMPAEDEERVNATFPLELVHFIRQYSTKIQMPYGRDMLVDGWNAGEHPLLTCIKQDTISLPELTDLATEYGQNYFVVDKHKTLEGNPEKNNVELVLETEQYLLYWNKNLPLLKKQ